MALAANYDDLAAKGYRWAPQRKRIVILGGGFAGMKTAECLEQKLHPNSSALITLVSETNALLFTPMLAEVAGSTLEPSHISIGQQSAKWFS
jgi:NADH dehydrogenase